MKSNKKSGFTLVEIMIVVIIIGLLALIAVPMLARNRAAAQRGACLNNLRQINANTQQYMLESNTTTVPSLATIANMFQTKATPTCPASGSYTQATAEDQLPTCSLGTSHNHKITP